MLIIHPKHQKSILENSNAGLAQRRNLQINFMNKNLKMQLGWIVYDPYENKVSASTLSFENRKTSREYAEEVFGDNWINLKKEGYKVCEVSVTPLK